MIPVTKTFFPPLGEYQRFLERIWGSNQVANGGDLWKELKEKLQNHLNSPELILTANGTLPIQIALKILAVKGEVITTPFSYVATTSALVWEGFTPVFVDIHPEYLTIDESKIESAITDKTTAILATHVFGNPCDVLEIDRIAKEYGLRVIYDSAHAFGVQYKGDSLFRYGDVSTCSFHATKLFHTGEGGAMFCADKSLYDNLFYSHNFGHDGPLEFRGLGINAKMNELQAAMGLAVLPYVAEITNCRKQIMEVYKEFLDFKNLSTIQIRKDTQWNYSYFPVIFEDEVTLKKVQQALNEKNIFPRRYFYPSLNTLDYVKYRPMSVSEGLSKRILCLPVYKELNFENISFICKIINDNM